MGSIAPKETYAYTTLITHSSYLAGVVILAHTLRQQKCTYPLVVLHTPDLPSESVKALELEALLSNLIVRQCDYLHPPDGTEVNVIAERFRDTWTKLRAFELVDFDAVCYLDADMAIFGKMDAVFDFDSELPKGWIAANQACVCNLGRDSWAPDDWRPENCAFTPLTHPKALHKTTQPQVAGPRTWGLINGGMFLFRPSTQLWATMLAEFNTTPLLSSFMFPDQDFLAHFFREKWMAIGWQYNAIKTMKYWHTNMWRDEEVVCLHYIVDKPWAKRIGADGVAGYRGLDGATHQRWWDAFEQWQTSRTDDAGKPCQVVDILSKHVATPK